MNKKGFTLIELLAVVAVIALVSLVAVPNIIGLQDNIRKDQMLDDAKKLISMAKYKVNTDYEIRNLTKSGVCVYGVSCTFTFASLNSNGDISQDPDSTSNPPANYLDGAVTYTVTNTSSGKEIKYCVYLEGSKRRIGSSPSNCLYEENLYSKSNVTDK